MNFNLFDIVSPNFFNIFLGESKYMYSNILYLLYTKSLDNKTYTFKKEEFIDIIIDYLQNHEFVIDNFEELGLKTIRDKATYIYRRIKYCAWIEEEISTNQDILVNFEDYAIAFFNTYINFNKNNSFELSSRVYNIYQNIVNFNTKQGYLTLHTIIEESRDLIRKLRSLNSNIKKYINRIINLQKMSDIELLNKILNDLLGEYKEKVIDKAYYYMKTNDNPVKYRMNFLKKLRLLEENHEILYEITSQIQKEDNLTYEEAKDKLNSMIIEIENIFETVIKIMEEIDKKNSKYINIAIEKIKIILNHDANIEGYLLEILKNIYDFDKMNFKIINKKNIHNNSLYTARTYKKIENSELLDEVETNENEYINIVKNTLKYSNKAIEKYVLNKLGNKDSLTIKDFNLLDKEEYIKFILMFAYQKDTSNYIIKFNNGIIEYMGIYIENFNVERK